MAENTYIPTSYLGTFSNALFAERLPDIGTREPYLMVDYSINQNKPIFSTANVKVHHFIRGEEKTKTFEIKTKPAYVIAALQQMIEYSKVPFGEPRQIRVWPILSPKFVNGRPSQEKIVSGKLVVGRKEEGVFISVVHWNEKFPQIAFFPGMHDINSVKNPAPNDAKENYDYVCSCARGWATLVSSMLSKEMPDAINRIFEAQRAQKGGNGYNGGNAGGNSGGYGGGYSSNSGGETSSTPYSTDGSEFNF